MSKSNGTDYKKTKTICFWMIVLAFFAHCDKLIADSLKSVINFSDSSNTRTGSRGQMSNYIQIHHGTKLTSQESKEVRKKLLKGDFRYAVDCKK